MLIFPGLDLKSWDGQPRFTFLDADLKTMQKKEEI